ncbi:hypothetical protein GRAQ_04720 [Rahnella aquatilis CIP 78.65 = ATCC 33071]|nr:hypothetical protein GRAQ_04720 [Rahnella aquatilis CIP 78.65 = ATCC 33071]
MLLLCTNQASSFLLVRFSMLNLIHAAKILLPETDERHLMHKKIKAVNAASL